jgi:hypothetical protein
MEQDAPVRDVEYLEALADAVRKGVRYGIEVVAVGEERAGEAPLAVIVQARLAARHRIPLATAMQRYQAAMTVLSKCVLDESIALQDCDPSLISTAMAAQGAAFDRLFAAATEEYGQGIRSRPASHEARLVEQVRRLRRESWSTPRVSSTSSAATTSASSPAPARPAPSSDAWSRRSAAAAWSSPRRAKSCGRGSGARAVRSTPQRSAPGSTPTAAKT